MAAGSLSKQMHLWEGSIETDRNIGDQSSEITKPRPGIMTSALRRNPGQDNWDEEPSPIAQSPCTSTNPITQSLASFYLWSQALACPAGLNTLPLRSYVTFISALLNYADRRYDATMDSDCKEIARQHIRSHNAQI